MICTAEQIETIIKTNPNKSLIQTGTTQADKLMLHLYGHGITRALIRNDYFESDDIFKVRNKDATSNKDLFGRVLQREEMVFSAIGGASSFSGISKAQTASLNATLDKIRFGSTLRNWIKSFALEAYRSDPMSVIFIEVKNEQPYPTYKCIKSIFDYQPNGRAIEYICFRLTVADAKSFNISDPLFQNMKATDQTNYFRFVDDAFDYIIKYENALITIQESAIPNAWGRVPAFIVSDIVAFDDPQKFLSPLDLTIELADSFLNDRSIRDLQKKYHGFLKAIEPLLKCALCDGTGFLSGAACPECTPAGSDRGTGYKLRTKVADVARFPLSILESGSFDFKKIFGYVGPDIEVWNKQDTSLNDIENLIMDVYWGTEDRRSTTGPYVGDKSIEETATKTLANLQPIYARLNRTADWAEKTENIIADFIGKFLFPSFKKSSITYGRYYILETPYELMEEYQEMKNKGASESVLFAALERYLHSMYRSNPAKLAVELKMIIIEPFIHHTIAQAQTFDPAAIDYMTKIYFAEWRKSQDFDMLLVTPVATLRASLYAFAQEKQKLIKEEPTPKVGITETV